MPASTRSFSRRRGGGGGGPSAIPHNSFGHLFRVTTWGESHGPAIGCVVDGCPPRITPLTRPTSNHGWIADAGASRGTGRSARARLAVRILSGVFDGMTTGTPIAMQIDNVNQRSRDYSAIAAQFRPGHADLTYELKYGVRDYRGGGRSLGAERDRDARGGRWRGAKGARRCCADPRRHWCRSAHTVSTAPAGTGIRWTANPFFCPDPVTAALWETYLSEMRKAGPSAGAVIEVVANPAFHLALAHRSTASSMLTSRRR